MESSKEVMAKFKSSSVWEQGLLAKATVIFREDLWHTYPFLRDSSKSFSKRTPSLYWLLRIEDAQVESDRLTHENHKVT